MKSRPLSLNSVDDNPSKITNEALYDNIVSYSVMTSSSD